MKFEKTASETIVAPATPPGESGIGVIRLSGPHALLIADELFRGKSGKRVSEQKNFTVRFGTLVDKAGAMIDEALILVMRQPRSYTGEDTVEISTHGGPAVIAAAVQRACEVGARMAEPGEFTKRAFMNGRLDLLQAEAVLDMIEAKTDRARRLAVSRLEGKLSKCMRDWKEALLEVLSHLEASVDFPDDFPETDTFAETEAKLQKIRRQIERLLRDSELSFLAKKGLSIVLYGRPNAGKSSLLNGFVRSNRVIVTPYPGTTRDVVEVEWSFAGIPVRIFDTAGIRDSDHPIEIEGVSRSKQALKSADYVLWVTDGSIAVESEDANVAGELSGKRVFVVLNKSDLGIHPSKMQLAKDSGWPFSEASCVIEGGTEALESKIEQQLANGMDSAAEEALLSTVRQKDLLEKVLKDLASAAESCRVGVSPELIAADVREAVSGLAEMTGEVVTDDILEIIFKQFCIGK